MNIRRLSLLILAIFFLSLDLRAETSVVPPGVRAFVYHHINAEVEGHLGPNGVEKPYALTETLSPTLIGQAEPKAANIIQRIQAADPNLLNTLDLGTVDMKPDIRVKVDVFGTAIGVSKDFMLVGVVPVYSANVNLAGGYQPTGTFSQAAARLETEAYSNPSAPRADLMALAQVLRQLQAPNGNNLQGVLVNNLGYKPIGNWSGQGIGDLMFYGQLRTINQDFYKQAFKVGAEVPTGRTDDPDNLVDVPFGKGHFVNFIEYLNDFYVVGNKWILGANAKYAYHWGYSPIYRLAPEGDIPLTSQKEQVYRKPGNEGILDLHSEVKLISDLYFCTDYIYSVRAKDHFSGNTAGYNYGNLEKNTDQESQTGEVGFSFTTANLFMQNRFPIPFKLGTFYSTVLGGRNVDKIDMATLRFEMYF